MFITQKYSLDKIFPPPPKISSLPVLGFMLRAAVAFHRPLKIGRVGQNRIYTVYDRIFGDFPAKNTVY